MATYKKRGYKPKTKVEQEVEVEDGSTTAEVFNTLDESASKTEEWAVKNQKSILVTVGAIAVVVLGYLSYTKYIVEPKQSDAMNEMFTAKNYFNEALNAMEKDSLFNLALNGAEGKFGFIDIIDNYGGTPAANLSNYYAGVSFYNLKDYQKAISYLSDFSSDDIILSALAKGKIGDAFAQLNQLDDALDYYEKAVAASDNDFTTPMFLYKAATVALNQGDAKKALAHFETIKNVYPKATEASNIDALIGSAKSRL